MYNEYYPELKTQKKLVKNIIKQEEISFFRTLENGLKRLDYLTKSKNVKGSEIFELYDTYGFPFDLTALILSEKNIFIDEKGFKEEMKLQKNRSKKSAEIELGDWTILKEKNETKFLGYDENECNSVILRYRKVKVKGKQLYHIILDKTPFYAEGGGQKGDSGTLKNEEEVIKVIDTKKESGSIIHITDNIFNDLDKTITASINKKKRELITANHTATHLLHHSLREILGKHIEQKGSFVGDKHLRFDFSHFEKIDESTLIKIEDYVNKMISKSLKLEENREANYEDEIKNGVLALFGEKYENKVRSIKFENSYELCGGTHTNNTQEIKVFKIISESSISSGVRRIEAITSDTAIDYMNKKNIELENIRKEFNNSKNILQDIKKLKEENLKNKLTLEKIEQQKFKDLKKILKNEINVIGDVNFISKKTNLDGKKIKELCFEMGGEVKNLVLAIASDYNNKVNFSVYISKNLVEEKKLNANNFIKEISTFIGGKGGGQPFFSVAGGNNIKGIEKSLETIKNLIS